VSDTGEANLAVTAAFVDELARRGVRQAVVCPGSRSTPLAVSLAAHPDLRVWVQIDERAAAFFALGMARQARQPVAILSTSGTAAANVFPAVIEASLSRVPLLALTADRPPELRGWGAAQTIDQIGLYGSHVKWFADMPLPERDGALITHARAAAGRAVQTALADPRGPVHLNFPFREPLLPSHLQPGADLTGCFSAGRSLYLAVAEPPAAVASDMALSDLAALVVAEPHGIIVCGPSNEPGLPPSAMALAAAAGYPVLADPLSGLRFGPRDHVALIDAYDPFLRDADIAGALRPRLVIRAGAIPTSKPLQQFLAAGRQHPHIVIDPGPPRDPDHLATTCFQADPAPTFRTLASRISSFDVQRDPSWLRAWTRTDGAARSAIERALLANDEPFEGRAAAEVAALLPDGATLVVGNSMPVRDVDAFVRGDRRCLRVVGTRGASGIDGVVSTALGAAAVASGPVVLLVGDLSFYHDLNGLLAVRRFGLNATVVVLNNDGGGIFSFLPQAGLLGRETFESLFGTPVGLDIAAAARLYGLSYERPEGWAAFRRAFCRSMTGSGASVIELVTDRERNVGQHRSVWAAVGEAVRSVQSGAPRG
jgi:2-succinyl-5-enolpyruvyl-6-hydroxy-3-cyclohexene-1-carboxylate synthase